jgi:hypothetical protein
MRKTAITGITDAQQMSMFGVSGILFAEFHCRPNVHGPHSSASQQIPLSSQQLTRLERYGMSLNLSIIFVCSVSLRLTFFFSLQKNFSVRHVKMLGKA